jgi:hypothetical protein
LHLYNEYSSCISNFKSFYEVTFVEFFEGIYNFERAGRQTGSNNKSIIERKDVFPGRGGGGVFQFWANSLPIFFILKVSILATELKVVGVSKI